MDSTKSKVPARVVRNAVMGIDGIAQLEPGTRIIYHRGPVFSLSENARGLGKVARDLMDLGRVWLYQQRAGHETYEWIAEVRG